MKENEKQLLAESIVNTLSNEIGTEVWIGYSSEEFDGVTEVVKHGIEKFYEEWNK